MPSDETLQAREQAKAQASGNKRFFRTVEVREAPAPSAAEPARDSGGYALYLGKYPIKTPGRRLLVLPSRALALAVAAEWEWQESSKPAMHSMPLMGLAATAIDQPKPREKVVETLLKYIHTDSALCRYEEGKMAQRQAQVFDPLLEWARATFGWSSLHSSDSIFGTQQEPEVVQGAQALLLSLDPWRLAAVEQLTYCSKSLLLALALLHGRIDRTQALTAARLEELTQCEEWGEVEAGHDLDSADIGSRVTAALVLIRLMDAHAKRTAPAAGGVK